MADMETFKIKVEQSGRILIPAQVRRKLHIQEGSEVIVRLDDSGFHVMSREQALNRIQQDLRKYIPEGRMLSEELLAERRQEAARESVPPAGHSK
jgi:AbrB family looped-hinge helix DNA binding protein